MARLAEAKQRGGGKIKPATVNRELALLRAAFNWAVENDTLPKGSEPAIKLKKENNIRDRELTDDEYSRLLHHCPDHLRLIVEMAWECGPRRGEIEGLKWDRVDLDQGITKLRPEDTKTDEGRKIPIPLTLLEKFRRLRATQAGQAVDIQTGPYVFRREVKGVLKWVGSTKRSFATACKKAGLEDFHFHDLRHCFVTRMRRDGVPDHVIMAITGHKTHAVFERYYSGPTMEQLQAAVSGGTWNERQSGISLVSIRGDDENGEL